MPDVAARASSARSELARAAPSRPRRVVAGELTVGLFGAGLAVLLIWILYGSSTHWTTERPSGISGSDPIEGRGRHVNSPGGYSFDPPAGWAVLARGSASELISPDAGVVMSFGAGRPGALSDATSALLDSLRGEYSDVRVGAPERTRVDDRPAVAVTGDLRNDAGVRVRFLGIATRVAGENRVIAVFVSQPAPVGVLRAVERVIGSFEAA